MSNGVQLVCSLTLDPAVSCLTLAFVNICGPDPVVHSLFSHSFPPAPAVFHLPFSVLPLNLHEDKLS